MKQQQLAIFTAVLAVLVILEAAFFAQLPLSIINVLYLPVIYVSRRSRRIIYLLGLIIFECIFSRLPILAGVSMLVVIETVLELLEGDFIVFSPVVSALVLPIVELTRQFWTSIFAALYELPPPPPLTVAQLIYASILGFTIFYGLRATGFEDAPAEHATQW